MVQLYWPHLSDQSILEVDIVDKLTGELQPNIDVYVSWNPSPQPIL
jgi:hypothetical protein